MNQTARLQSLGEFRETLVMESVRQAIEGLDALDLKALEYGPLTETPVKNVEKPLRHFKLTFSGPQPIVLPPLQRVGEIQREAAE